MRTIRINTQADCYWLFSGDEWKGYCGCTEEEFGETYVIKGNRDYKEIAEASWFEKATDLINDLEQEVDRKYFTDLTDAQYGKAKEVIEKCRYSDDFDTIIKVLNILYPEDEFKSGTIRGYCQRDWQEVLYKVNVPHNLELLEAYYFGMITEIYDETENIVECVTDDAIWDAERKGEIEKFVRETLDIPENEEIKILMSDGYVTTIKWKEVN